MGGIERVLEKVEMQNVCGVLNMLLSFSLETKEIPTQVIYACRYMSTPYTTLLARILQGSMDKNSSNNISLIHDRLEILLLYK